MEKVEYAFFFLFTDLITTTERKQASILNLVVSFPSSRLFLNLQL